MKKNVAVIGAGFSGLSAAAYLAKAGHKVKVIEQHDIPGGRARQFRTDNGYVFDMGPSWYWMPDIIEQYFNDFDSTASHFYELVNLDPQFEIVFNSSIMQVPSDYNALQDLFESKEKGAAQKLSAFMDAAAYKYEVGMQTYVQKPCLSWTEFMNPTIAKSALKLNLLSNFRTYVGKYFQHPELRTLMEFPVIFLGASPKKIPALYSLMNFGGYKLGTWYPQGGFFQLVLAMENIARKQGVQFQYKSKVEEIISKDGKVEGLMVNGVFQPFDAVIASADYHHSETLLAESDRNYSEKYWHAKTFAPSCLLFYIGVNRKIPKLKHHTLFFEHDLDQHIDEIYKNKQWPKAPLFYCCCPSKTDHSVAPTGHENLFLLMPLAIGIEDTEELREKYFAIIIKRLAKYTGIEDIELHIDYKRSYCVNDFNKDYNAYKGNAYGLANTLAQTAVLKPSIKNKKIDKLYYAGQLTVPGPGVPPSIISGKIAANLVSKEFQN